MDQLDSHQGQPRQLDDRLASLFQGGHASSSSSSASSSHGLLLSLSQTLHGLQAHPSESIPQLQEEMLPLLSLPAPDGVSALLPIWKGAFEGKASEPTGYTSNEEVRTNVQIALASARLLRNVVGGCEPLQNLVFARSAGDILALLRLGSSLAFVSDPELQPLLRSLVQLLSNLVTLNKPLQKSLFYKLRLIPSASSSSSSSVERITVLQNLLSSPDSGTVEAVQILLLNCIKTSATNSSGLAVSPGGRRLLGQLLGLFEAAVAEEEDDGFGLADSPLVGPVIVEEEEEEDDIDDVDDEDEEEHATGQMDDFGADELQMEEPPSVDQTGTSRSGSGERSIKDTIAAMQNGKGERRGKKSGRKNVVTAGEADKRNGASTPTTVGYAIFAHLFSIGLFRHMYANLGPASPSTPTQFSTSDEPLVTTEQTLLLKTLDAWINAGGQHHPMDDLSSIDQFKNLPGEFVRLSRFVRRFIADFENLEKEVEKSGGVNAAGSQDVDRRMIGAHQALVLILEVLVQLGMIGCEGLEEDEQFREESEEILRRMRSAPTGASVASANGDGSDEGLQAPEEAGQLAQEELDVVAELLLLLRAVMSFAPPVSPFKSTLPQSGRAVPEGHAPTSTGLGLGSATSTASSPLAASKPRLDNLQRTLIQLLGVLVFVHSPSSLPQSFQERSRGENEEERRSVTRVQDRVRELGGLASVLGCTRVDERNPYIREHAIFTLRYLLQDNLDSQEYIAKLQPVGHTGQ